MKCKGVKGWDVLGKGERGKEGGCTGQGVGRVGCVVQGGKREDVLGKVVEGWNVLGKGVTLVTIG